MIGLVAGTGGALALSDLLRALLYQMSPSDWSTNTGVAALLALAAGLACYIPARDAMRVDVTATLREE